MRLAIVTSHPIQYLAPWFELLAGHGGLDLKVFYLWNREETSQHDHGFGQAVIWDLPLLRGYAHEFVPNVATQPGTEHFSGLNNPDLTARVDAFQPQAVLLFGYNYLSYYRFLLSWRRRSVPLLFRGDSHRLVPAGGIRGVSRRLWIGQVFKRFDAFLYVGKANKRYFTFHGVAEPRLFLCPHAVDNRRFVSATQAAKSAASTWKKELGIERSRRVILFAGKFQTKKRPEDLLAAFRMAELQQVSLLLVGGGEQEQLLRNLAIGDPNIVFAPFQNQSQMARAYALADLFVLPSYGPGETWGLAVNEAMCLGCPIVVSNHVGCAEDLVEPHRNGLIFPAGDVCALAATLREAFSDTRRLKAWGDASRKKIMSYSYDQTTEGLFTALHYLLGKEWRVY